MIPATNDSRKEFRAPGTITPGQLGDDIARLVWESFTDFIAEGDAEALLGEMGIEVLDGVPTEHAAEEMLIFFMWAHTRGVQQAFLGRAPGGLVREGLDALHSAVFEDMVSHGTPRVQLPLFEQRVGANRSNPQRLGHQHRCRVGETDVPQIAVRHEPR